MFNKFLKLFFFVNFVSVFAQSELRINEILTSNVNGLVDTESGKFSDWIEIYNASDSLIDLSSYYLTDNYEKQDYWQFPTKTRINPNSFLIIWADKKDKGLHTNFKLNSDGEQIYLLNNKLEIIDSIIYSEQRADVSYGRTDSNYSVLHYFAEPTPGQPNSSKSIEKLKVSDFPKISLGSGFYESPISIEILTNKDGTVYYTKDGSIPTESTGIIYESAITIDSTTVLRIIQIEENELPSDVITNTYFINESINMPVVSLTTEPKNLWDDEIGINTIGTNGISFWDVKANYWQKWERPVNIELFERNKNSAFNIKGGLAISGARRNMLQKSFRIFARKKYGTKSINYRVFDNYERRNFNSLVLRNGGYEDFISTIFRDGFIHTLISKNMNLEYQAYKPSVLFINGKYWGIYNIREKQNEEYLNEIYGVDPKNLDILENNIEIVEGDDAHYKNMISFIENNDISTSIVYDSVKQLMDIDNFIDYQIAQQYIANVDWPANNIKYWRPKTENGKWRWMLFDVDAGFGLWGNYDFNSLEYASEENSSHWSNLPWSTFLFRSLLKNQEFRNKFVQRFATYLSYNFTSEKVISIMDSIKNIISDEFPKHINRWALGCSPYNPESKDGCLFDNIDEWYNNIAVVREFAEKRPGYMFNFLKDYFGLINTHNLSISSNNNVAGSIFINNVKTVFGETGELFEDINVNIRVKPKAGYRFVRWEGDYQGKELEFDLSLTKNTTIKAIFEHINQNIIPEKIISDLELTQENSPYTSNGDIYIYENTVLTINPNVKILMPKDANIFVWGGLEILGDKENPVIIKPKVNEERWGAICFEDATNKSKISYCIIKGTSFGKDVIKHIGGISASNSTLEVNNLEMDSVLFPIFIQKGRFQIRNSKIIIKVISDGINVKSGTGIIENCEFIGGYSKDTDAIDFDDVSFGIIRRNIIHDLLGDNNDGIDLGEKTSNVKIEDNLIYNCDDKGISIGQGSSAIIKGNIIVNCDLGIGIKDDRSYGFIDHNTFFENNIAVSCFEKSAGNGGGKADITNTIFSKSFSEDIYADELSEVHVKYSLSDKELLTGEGNIYGDPEFINPDSMNFLVGNSSIAVDSGDPNYILDPDGSRTNIGASYFDFNNKNSAIINEINYNSSSEFDAKDWIELYNPNDYEINMSNWIFKDDNDDHRFILPNSSVINANSFIVLCKDSLQFRLKYPNIKNILGNFDFGLNNGGELLRIYDNRGNIIDSLTYDDKAPWPIEADGEGYTLQLNDYSLDNALGKNWNATALYGTPGETNIIVNVKEPLAVPTKYSLMQNYPNPFNPSTNISFTLPKRTKVKLKVYNILGSEIITLVDDDLEAGSYEYIFNSETFGKALSSGVYIYRLFSSEFQETKKMMFLK